MGKSKKKHKVFGIVDGVEKKNKRLSNRGARRQVRRLLDHEEFDALNTGMSLWGTENEV